MHRSPNFRPAPSLKALSCGLLLSLLGTAAQAHLTVVSYTMTDGADLHGAYYDNAYNGTRDANRWLSGGTGDLTDGVTSVSVAAGYGAWAPYVLWDGLSPVITFDLGGPFTLSSVTTYFKFYPQAAVYMPGSMSLRYSDDGLNFGAAQLRSLSDVERAPGGNDSDGVFELLSGAAQGRYVELTLNNGPENRWLALAEVQFDGTPGGTALDPNRVPEPASTALVLLALAALGRSRSSRPRC